MRVESPVLYWLYRLNPWINFVVAVVLAVQRAYWELIPGWFCVATAVVSAGSAIAAQASIRYDRSKWASDNIQELLAEIRQECHDRARTLEYGVM